MLKLDVPRVQDLLSCSAQNWIISVHNWHITAPPLLKIWLTLDPARSFQDILWLRSVAAVAVCFEPLSPWSSQPDPPDPWLLFWNWDLKHGKFPRIFYPILASLMLVHLFDKPTNSDRAWHQRVCPLFSGFLACLTPAVARYPPFLQALFKTKGYIGYNYRAIRLVKTTFLLRLNQAQSSCLSGSPPNITPNFPRHSPAGGTS